MRMEKIRKGGAPATARFVPVTRVVARWQPNEIDIVKQAVADGLDLEQAHKMLPHRSWHSVKDQFYRARGWTNSRDDCADSAAVDDACRQKDARQGSARLLQALRDAGFIVNEDVLKRPPR